jgi:hypothetical protein
VEVSYLFDTATACAAIGITKSFPLAYRLTPSSTAIRIASNAQILGIALGEENIREYCFCDGDHTIP